MSETRYNKGAAIPRELLNEDLAVQFGIDVVVVTEGERVAIHPANTVQAGERLIDGLPEGFSGSALRVGVHPDHLTKTERAAHLAAVVEKMQRDMGIVPQLGE